MPLPTLSYLKSLKANGDINCKKQIEELNKKIKQFNNLSNDNDGSCVTFSGSSMIHSDSDFSCSSLPGNYCSE